MKNFKQIIGLKGELIARRFLIENGYQIIDSNLRLGHNEIDLVTKIDDQVVLIEVKSVIGNKYGPAIDQVRRRKYQAMLFSMKKYSEKYKVNLDKMRYDLLAIDLEKDGKIKNVQHLIGVI